METDALRWFQLIADGATMTEIGDVERISQSGISRALARLETDIGTPLLSRSGRLLRTTHAGAVFKRHVDALLNELDDGLAAVSELVDPESGLVALAFHLSLATWMVPDLVSSFRAVHPQVRFALRPLRDETISVPDQWARVDLAITTVRPRESGVRWRSLLIEPLRLAVPMDHPLAGRTELALREVADEQFIVLRPSSLLRQLGDQLCTAAGFSPQIAFVSDDIPTARGFVAAGLGISIVPAVHVGSPDVATGALRQIPITDPGAHREIGLTWSSTRRLLPTAQLFRRHVVDRATSDLLPAVADNG